MLPSGQSVVDQQLQQNSDFLEYKMFQLCADNMDATLPIQLQLTFNMLLLKILCRRFSFGKCLFTSFTNIFPMLVFKFNENGRLNHVAFLLRFVSTIWSLSQLLLEYKASFNPLLLSASKYGHTESLKNLSSHKMSDMRLAMDFRSCFRTTAGWLNSLLI